MSKYAEFLLRYRMDVDVQDISNPRTVVWNGAEYPREFAVRIESRDWVTGVRLIYRVDEDLGPTVVGVASLDGPEVVGVRSALKQLTDVRPLDQWTPHACTCAVTTFFKMQVGETLLRDPAMRAVYKAARAGDGEARADWQHAIRKAVDERADDLAAYRRQSRRPQGQRRRRRVSTAEHLQEVADVYKAAVRAGIPPTDAVSRHCQVSYSTAARYVGESRRNGLLPKTTPGKVTIEEQR